MQNALKCLIPVLLFSLCHTSCRKAETQEVTEKIRLESKKANTNPTCCEVKLTLAEGDWAVTVSGQTYHYQSGIIDKTRLTESVAAEICLVRCAQDDPPQFEWLKRDQFFTVWGFLNLYSGIPAPTCPPSGTQCLWTHFQIQNSGVGFDTKSIGYSLDELTDINAFMPRIEAEDPLMLMMTLEKLKCKFFRRYSGDAPEIPFTLAEEGNFVIAIYVDAADNTDDGFGNPLPNYSRAAVLQPGWNNRDYISWGQAATSVVKPFYGTGDYYATEEFYNGPGVDPSKFFFYVYTPDQCGFAGPACY